MERVFRVERPGLAAVFLFGLFALIGPARCEVYQPPDREPTAEETLILELINRFRANPVAEADRLGFKDEAGEDMRKLKPLPPMVMNLNLLDAARKHSYYMILNTLTHSEDKDKPGFYGVTPWERAPKSGYTGFCGAENCFRDPGDPYGSHAGFAHSKGHRDNMASGHREVGTGGVPHEGRLSVTHLFGTRGVPRMAGGVAYQDANGNNFYDVGEGIGGVKISASDGTGTSTWKSGGYALDLKSAKAVTLTAEFMGRKFTKTFEAGGDNIKFDVLIPETLVNEGADKLIAAVQAAGAPESPKYFSAVLNLYLEAKGLRLEAERQKRFNELTAKAGPELEANRKAVRQALEDFDPPAFAKVFNESRKAYSGTPAEAWFRDASLIANLTYKVSVFEKQNAVQKTTPRQKRAFAAEIEAAEKQFATRDFVSDLAVLAGRARNAGAPPPTVAESKPATPPAATVSPPVAATKPAAEPKPPVAAPAAPALLPPAKAEPPVSAQALGPWVDKLRRRVIEGVKAGQKPNAYLALFGGKETAIRILAADDKELTLEVGGGKLPVAWTRLDQRKDMLNLVKAFGKDDSAADGLLKVVFLLANEFIQEATDEYWKATELKPPEDDENVEAVRRLLKL
ncbi:MAG: CAP domain-containing protein [Planctomycetota bacterium]